MGTPRPLRHKKASTKAIHPASSDLFEKYATRLSKQLPGADPAALAEAMAAAAKKYTDIIEGYRDGGKGKLLRRVENASNHAARLIDALGELGPRGRNLTLQTTRPLQEFLDSEHGQWLVRISNLRISLREEFERKAEIGRPTGSTQDLKVARAVLLSECSMFLPQNPKSQTMVPSVARTIHRLMCEPDLPSKSQLFNKEWVDIFDSKGMFRN